MGQGSPRPGGATVAKGPRLALIDQAFGVERGDHRRLEPFSKPPDLWSGIGPEGASAGQNHRPMGPREKGSRLRDGFSIDARLVRRGETQQIGGQTARLPHEVLRQEQRRGTGTAGRHGLEGQTHHRVNLLALPDGATPLRDGPEDGLEIDLMVIAALTVEIGHVHLSGEQEQGDGISPGLGHPRKGVGRPWTGRGANNARSRGDPRITIGHECPGLLVAGQDRFDHFSPRQGVVDRRRMRPGHAKDMFDAVVCQSFHQSIRASLDVRMRVGKDRRFLEIDPMASVYLPPPYRRSHAGSPLAAGSDTGLPTILAATSRQGSTSGAWCGL